VNNVRKIAAGATLIGALIGGGALTAMALPANAATTDTSTTTSTGSSAAKETELTGDTAAKVKAAVLAANAGATVDRMETEGDGSAAYEAHITKTDGTHATVKLDANYTITATETGGHGGKGGGNETELTGDTAAKVRAAVLAANAGATVDRMETEGDGSAAYEAHITKTDGTHATVKLDTNYTITATETGGHGGRGGNETELTGDTAAKVKAAVLAANAGATVDRMETEGDGSAAYEAHITKTDGTHATVKLDTNYTITATETGGH
jgi:uncharacterized membrane protein YkoI